MNTKTVFAVHFILVSSCLLLAQEYRGSITGSVTDPKGALVPNAKIEAVETHTGSVFRTATDAQGQYSLPFLAPGVYKVTIETPGFKRFVQESLTLNSDEHPRLDIQMELGASSQTVTVTAQPPLLETTTATVGQVFDSRQVQDIPLNGGTPLVMTELALGVVVTASTGIAVHPYDVGGASSTSMGGAPSLKNEILLDGVPGATWDSRMAYSPPRDAVEEARVNIFDPDAAYGHTGGGTANLITKNGTNAFHGSAYEFNQITQMYANTFFSNAENLPKPPSTYNQYGLTGGGPVFLPKIYDGKNRLFWFFAWEGIRSDQPLNNIWTVPTPAERNGDFSALLARGSSYTIYDPNSGVQTGSQILRTPFPGNVIPAARLNPVAQAFQKYYPLPNIAGRADGFDNYAVNAPALIDYNNEFARFDYNIKDNHKLFGDFRRQHDLSNANHYLGSSPAVGEFLYRTGKGASLDDVYIFNAATVMNIRANWTQFNEVHATPADGIDPASLGFPGYIDSNSSFLQLPYVRFGNCAAGTSGTSFGCLGANAGNIVNNFDQYQIFADVTRLAGNHDLKLGGDVRDYRLSSISPGNSSGSYIFGTTWANGPYTTSAASPLGQDYAGFLLGLPTSGTFDSKESSAANARYFGLFLQDNWRTRSNLTLNLGIRWEHETPATERYNRVVNGFNESAASPIAAAAMAAYALSPVPQIPVSQFKVDGGLTFASASNPGLYSTRSELFSPRFGFAWKPDLVDRKMVVRGGFGVFTYPIGIANALALNQQGFSQQTTYIATNNNYLSPASSLSNPFPNGIGQPTGSSLGLATYLGQAITFFNPQVLNPYSLRWDFGIQRMLPGNILFEVAYIGNHSVHLLVASTQLNDVPPQYLSTSLTRNQAAISLLGGTVANPFQNLLPNSSSQNGKTVALQQLLVPYPQFPLGSATSSGIILQDNSAGSSYYESLNVRFEKRLSNLSFIANFIWNSLIERVAYLNDSDEAPEKRISTDSRPLRFVSTASYRLPIGSGRLLGLSGWKDRIVGGWVLNGIYTWQLGPPLSWGNLLYYGGSLNLNPRETNGPAFDTARFNTVSAQQLGDNIRTFDTLFNNLRSDGVNNLDGSLLKDFRFAERRYVQIRFEVFNTMNHVQFGPPNLTATGTSFGLITTQINSSRHIQVGARLVW